MQRKPLLWRKNHCTTFCTRNIKGGEAFRQRTHLPENGQHQNIVPYTREIQDARSIAYRHKHTPTTVCSPTPSRHAPWHPQGATTSPQQKLNPWAQHTPCPRPSPSLHHPSALLTKQATHPTNYPVRFNQPTRQATISHAPPLVTVKRRIFCPSNMGSSWLRTNTTPHMKAVNQMAVCWLGWYFRITMGCGTGSSLMTWMTWHDMPKAREDISGGVSGGG